MFFDEAKIYVKAGDGGRRRGLSPGGHVPRGGPSGGNGGRGGDVYLVADLQIKTWIAFSKQIHSERLPATRAGARTRRRGWRRPADPRAGRHRGLRSRDRLDLADLIHPDQRVLSRAGAAAAAAATGPSSPRRYRRRASPRTANRAKIAGSGWS